MGIIQTVFTPKTVRKQNVFRFKRGLPTTVTCWNAYCRPRPDMRHAKNKFPFSSQSPPKNERIFQKSIGRPTNPKREVDGAWPVVIKASPELGPGVTEVDVGNDAG